MLVPGVLHVPGRRGPPSKRIPEALGQHSAVTVSGPGRGNGIQLLLIYHDIAQVEHLYGGREVVRTVLSNAKMRMLLPGVGDLDTLRYWSELMGRTRTQTHGETYGEDGRRSRSRNEHADDLAPLHLLQQLPDGDAVLLCQNLPPARVRLLPWFTSRRFRALRREPVT